jgi:hypothetical protein
MNQWNWRHLFMVLLITVAGMGMIGGCDSGEKVVDEVTGHRAVKQYQKSKKDLEKIEEQQAERYKAIPDDGNKDDQEK